MEGKIESMRVLDNNPEKPVVRMANLCVVAAHTVFLFHCHILHPVFLKKNSCSTARYTVVLPLY